MKKILVILFFLLFVISCDSNPTVKPGYILTEARPIGFKAEPVEAVPGDTVSMSLLVGGRTFSQDSDLSVLWLGMEKFTLPYTTSFTLKVPENIDDIAQLVSDSETAETFLESFRKNGFADIPVFASFDIPIPDTQETRTITATKTVRIYEKVPKSGVHINPVILNVQAAYLINGYVEEVEIKNGDDLTFSLDKIPNTIGFKSVVDENTDYDRLNYRWYFTSDTGLLLENDIDIKLDLSDLGDFVPKDQKVTPNRQYFAADFTKIIEEIRSDPTVLPVKFNFYNVIRDRAASAESSADYRWGSDYMWFNIEITE